MHKRPKVLSPGDRIATVSLSWGGAGDPDLLWRYKVAKFRLETELGLEVVEMDHTLRGSSFLADNPQARASDLMQAFQDPSIKGIFSCIGGNDSLRMLPYLDFQFIRNNPKIFLGYSDSTVTHLICYKAGFTSFYGPSLLAEFAENVEIYPYTAHWVKKVLFSDEHPLIIDKPDYWTAEYLSWTMENRNVRKTLTKHEGYKVAQGNGVAQGPLLGGCIEVLHQCIGSSIFPDFSNSLLFLESSEEAPSPPIFRQYLVDLAKAGMFDSVCGVLLAKPYQGRNEKAYLEILLSVLAERNQENLLVAYNLAFGHNEPMFILGYGVPARFDSKDCSFVLLEAGCVKDDTPEKE